MVFAVRISLPLAIILVLCNTRDMNIFYLDPNPILAAQYHNDKHCVKMILETAQLLCTAHHVLDGPKEGLYKCTHKNHPCSIWVRESKANYNWTYQLFVSLSQEYKYRYGKDHKSFKQLGDILSIAPTNIPSGNMTNPALAMPDHFKHQDPVQSYRNYYCGDKARLANWTKRDTPQWFVRS